MSKLQISAHELASTINDHIAKFPYDMQGQIGRLCMNVFADILDEKVSAAPMHAEMPALHRARSGAIGWLPLVVTGGKSR